jgi:hypothetical protein
MSETVSTRRRKRIVEHIVYGFKSAHDAIQFGNTIDMLVTDAIGRQKFDQQIAAPGTSMAITMHWVGPTVLKTIYLNLESQEMSVFITGLMKSTIGRYNKEYNAELKIAKELVREKPQEQRIDASLILSTTKLNSIG